MNKVRIILLSSREAPLIPGHNCLAGQSKLTNRRKLSKEWLKLCEPDLRDMDQPEEGETGLTHHCEERSSDTHAASTQTVDDSTDPSVQQCFRPTLGTHACTHHRRKCGPVSGLGQMALNLLEKDRTATFVSKSKRAFVDSSSQLSCDVHHTCSLAQTSVESISDNRDVVARKDNSKQEDKTEEVEHCNKELGTVTRPGKLTSTPAAPNKSQGRSCSETAREEGRVCFVGEASTYSAGQFCDEGSSSNGDAGGTAARLGAEAEEERGGGEEQRGDGGMTSIAGGTCGLESSDAAVLCYYHQHRQQSGKNSAGTSASALGMTTAANCEQDASEVNSRNFRSVAATRDEFPGQFSLPTKATAKMPYFEKHVASPTITKKTKSPLLPADEEKVKEASKLPGSGKKAARSGRSLNPKRDSSADASTSSAEAPDVRAKASSTRRCVCAHITRLLVQ